MTTTTTHILNRLADLEASIADCETQLADPQPLKDAAWADRCRYAVSRMRAQRLALLKLMEDFEPIEA